MGLVSCDKLHLSRFPGLTDEWPGVGILPLEFQGGRSVSSTAVLIVVPLKFY